jgi:hypothetical protein
MKRKLIMETNTCEQKERATIWSMQSPLTFAGIATSKYLVKDLHREPWI